MSKIEWTGKTCNPIRARGPNGKSGHYCVKVSPGCKHCYSSAFQPRLGLPVFQEQAKDPPELFLDAKTLTEVLRRRTPTTWFWCSMTDLFGEWVPDEWIAACFGVMAATPHHTHQVLTKRPERAVEWFASLPRNPLDKLACVADDATEATAPRSMRAWAFATGKGANTWPLPNVWLGTSVESQRYADERIPQLLQFPAAVRFISAEPLLGPLELPRHDQSMGPSRSPLDWVIVGGESGNGARPCDIGWIRDLVRQCHESNTPCFMKQLGRVPLVDSRNAHGFTLGQLDASTPEFGDNHCVVRLRHNKGGDPSEWPSELRIRQLPRTATP